MAACSARILYFTDFTSRVTPNIPRAWRKLSRAINERTYHPLSLHVLYQKIRATWSKSRRRTIKGEFPGGQGLFVNQQ